MKKITELTETKWRTVYLKDEYGNRERDREEYNRFRPVNSITHGPRIGHFFADYFLFIILIHTISSFTLSSNVFNLNFIILNNSLTVLGYPIYYFIFELIWQQTPGKYLTGCKVIDEYGNKPTWQSIALRSIIRIIPFEPISNLYDNCYGWHDKWTRTWVVDREELKTLKKLQFEQSEDKDEFNDISEHLTNY